MDFPGRLIAGIMAIILIIIFPLQYIAHSHSEDIDALIDDKTHRFTDEIRQRGYLDIHMYEEYVNFLYASGERFEINIQDIRPVKGEAEAHNLNYLNTASLIPVVYSKTQDIQSFAAHTHTDDCYAGHRHTSACKTMPLLYKQSVDIQNGSTTFQIYIYCPYCKSNLMWYRYISNFNSTSYIYLTVYTKTPYYNYVYVEGQDSQFSTIANQIRNFMETLKIYKRYQKELRNGDYKEYIGFVPSKDATFDLPIHEKISECHACNESEVLDIEVYSRYEGDYIRKITLTCNYCGRKIAEIENNTRINSATLTIYRNDTAIYTNSNYDQINPILLRMSNYISSGQTKNFSNKHTIFQFDILKDAINHGCTYADPLCQLTEDTNPICNQVVVSITATHPNQTVNKGGTIITTATATYLDGHTGTVNCTSNFNPNFEGNQTVTLTYTGLVGNAKTRGTRTCTITVTVRPLKTLSSITVTPTTQTININTNPTFTVKANYSDGSSKTLNSGEYTISGFNSSKAGTQTVTISYTDSEVTKTATVTVIVRALSSLTVTPATQTIQRYQSPTFTVKANYTDGSSKTLTLSQYTVSGFNASKIGTQTVIISYTDNTITKTASVTVIVTVLKRECPRCHTIYDLNTDDSDPGCPVCNNLVIGIKVNPEFVEVTQGNSLPITVTAIYNNGVTKNVSGWTSNYNPSRIGFQIVTIEYGGYAQDITVWVKEKHIKCSVCGTEYPQSQGKCPVCSEKVVSISVEPKEITVRQYEQIMLTVKATFATGETRVVDDWSIDRNTSSPGTFNATVSYKGATATIKLTVLALFSEQCPICGLIYDPSQYLKGCPVCSEELIGIEAYLTSGTNLVQLGATPSIAVVLIFRDEHREFAYEGYTLEGFNPNILGVQTVKVIYKDFYTTIIIEVVNTLETIMCPNGHVYYRNADGSDPGCPFCKSETVSGKVIYFDITYTSEILDVLYSSGIYYFQKGNYISVMVIKKDKSLLYEIQKMFFGTSLLGRKKRFVYGGEV